MSSQALSTAAWKISLWNTWLMWSFSSTTLQHLVGADVYRKRGHLFSYICTICLQECHRGKTVLFAYSANFCSNDCSVERNIYKWPWPFLFQTAFSSWLRRGCCATYKLARGRFIAANTRVWPALVACPHRCSPFSQNLGAHFVFLMCALHCHVHCCM